MRKGRYLPKDAGFRRKSNKKGSPKGALFIYGTFSEELQPHRGELLLPILVDQME